MARSHVMSSWVQVIGRLCVTGRLLVHRGMCLVVMFGDGLAECAHFSHSWSVVVAEARPGRTGNRTLHCSGSRD